MATKENSALPNVFKRQLLDVQFQTYRRIVERKHGVSVPLTPEAAVDLSDEDLLAYVDSLREMAHLPPV
jgi:hypothetical protein